jgi:hypothetical protein
MDGMQLVTRGVKTAMDVDSPDDLNPEDNGKIEEFAHAYLTSDKNGVPNKGGIGMFMQTTYESGEVKTKEFDWFHWALNLRDKYKDKPEREVLGYISHQSKKKNPKDRETSPIISRHFIAVI